MSIPDTDITTDALLGGRVTLVQPRRGYRAGADPVLLAAAIPATAGQTILDLGCGAGAAFLCLAARVPGLDVTGVERDPLYAALALRNANANGLAAQIVEADVTALPADLRQSRFDHVIANPPYFDRQTGTASPDRLREAALGETAPLSDWVEAGSRRLAPRGHMTVIQKADRLPDLLTAMSARLGSITICAIVPRPGRDASLVIVSGRKGGRAPARIAPAFVLHEGADTRDAKDYSARARAVLMDAAALPQ